MGAICRVKVYYVETESFLHEIRKLDLYPLIGTVLEGENIYQSKLSQKGVIVMGNESKGISPALINKLDYKLTIPKAGSGFETSESLNVATAAAIVMAEFRRREMQ
jgi:TrmH family RNA methyltransferase